MQPDALSILFNESIKIVIILSAPLLLSILFFGLIVSILQAVTQINEYTLSFIPKIISVFLILFFFGSWMLNLLLDYIKNVFYLIPKLIYCYVT